MQPRVKYIIDIINTSLSFSFAHFTVHLNKWSRFSRSDARDARLKLPKLSENPRNYQFVEERTRQQRCYCLEFDEALGESRGTIVPPTPGLQHQDPRPFESKTTRVKVLPYYEADTDDNASNGGLSRLFAFRVAKLLSVHSECNTRSKPVPLRYVPLRRSP